MSRDIDKRVEAGFWSCLKQIKDSSDLAPARDSLASLVVPQNAHPMWNDAINLLRDGLHSDKKRASDALLTPIVVPTGYDDNASCRYRFIQAATRGVLLVMSDSRAHWEEGIGFCSTALDLCKNDSQRCYLYFRRATGWMRLRRNDSAELDFREALELASDPAERGRINVNQAINLYEMGEFDEAFEVSYHASEDLRHTPLHRLALNNCAFYKTMRYILQTENPSDLDSAEHCAKQSTRAFKLDNPEGWAALGVVELFRSRHTTPAEKAAKHVDRASAYFTKAATQVSNTRLTSDSSLDCIGLRTLEALSQLHPGVDPLRRVSHDILFHFLCDMSEFLGTPYADVTGDRRFLLKERTIADNERSLTVIRRWNSFTPCVPSKQGERTQGGGYFVAWNGYGIVVDPGFGFVNMFDNLGHSLADIDGIVLTHAHIDHMADFERLMTLLFEANEARPNERNKIDLYLNLGTNIKLANWIATQAGTVRSIRLLVPDDVRSYPEHELRIDTHPAFHNELVTSQFAIGFTLRRPGKKPGAIIGFVGDTRFEPLLPGFYEDCDVVIAHLGTTNWAELVAGAGLILGAEVVEDTKKLREAGRFTDLHLRSLGISTYNAFEELACRGARQDIRIGDHLGVTGLYKLVSSLAAGKKKERLFLISEFGSELGYLRTHVARAFDREFAKRGLRFLTADIGTKLDFARGGVRVWCDGGFEDYRGVGERCSRDGGISYVGTG